jgi:hypothetical protein
MRTISFSEMLSCGAEAPPEIGEDDVPYCSRISKQHRDQGCCHAFSSERKLGDGSELGTAPVALDGFPSLSKTLSRVRVLTLHAKRSTEVSNKTVRRIMKRTATSVLNRFLVGLALLAATSAFAANRASLSIHEGVSVSVLGTHLPAGEYKVKWEGDGPNVELNILHDGKLVAIVPARTIELQQKDPQDSVMLKKNSDGTESVVEIHVGV